MAKKFGWLGTIGEKFVALKEKAHGSDGAYCLSGGS